MEDKREKLDIHTVISHSCFAGKMKQYLPFCKKVTICDIFLLKKFAGERSEL